MADIAELMQAHKDAIDAVRDELLRMYPIGSTVEFTIMHGQKFPSTGTVIDASRLDVGYLCVEHHQAKERSRYKYRTVHHGSIF